METKNVETYKILPGKVRTIIKKIMMKEHIWNFKNAIALATNETVNIEVPVVEVVRNEIRNPKRKRSILLVKKRLQNDLVSSCKSVFVEPLLRS